MLTRSQIIKDALSTFDDPDMRYYTQAELDEWLNDTILEISNKCGYEKDTVTVLGSTYVVALGTSPRFFELPSDTMHIDDDNGVLVNGIRRLGTTNREVDMLSQKAIGYIRNTLSNINTVITMDDYFDESLYPEINHYSVDYLVRSVTDKTGALIYSMATGGTGRLMWFAPDIADTDEINYTIVKLPDLTTTGTTTTSVMRQHDEAVKLGLKVRMAPKGVSKQLCTIQQWDIYIAQSKAAIADIQKDLSNTTPDKMQRIKGPRQMGLYNSRAWSGMGCRRGGMSE